MARSSHPPRRLARPDSSQIPTPCPTKSSGFPVPRAGGNPGGHPRAGQGWDGHQETLGSTGKHRETNTRKHRDPFQPKPKAGDSPHPSSHGVHLPEGAVGRGGSQAGPGPALELLLTPINSFGTALATPVRRGSSELLVYPATLAGLPSLVLL